MVLSYMYMGGGGVRGRHKYFKLRSDDKSNKVVPPLAMASWLQSSSHNILYIDQRFTVLCKYVIYIPKLFGPLPQKQVVRSNLGNIISTPDFWLFIFMADQLSNSKQEMTKP